MNDDLSAKAARHLAARLTDSGTEISTDRVQELAAGRPATDGEADAISQLGLLMMAEYSNRGGKEWALVGQPLDGASADDAVARMLRFCGRLLGRAE